MGLRGAVSAGTRYPRLQMQGIVWRRARDKRERRQVGLDNDRINTAGSKTALEHTLVQGERAPNGSVPRF